MTGNFGLALVCAPRSSKVERSACPLRVRALESQSSHTIKSHLIIAHKKKHHNTQ
jgi:hypothetical protein